MGQESVYHKIHTRLQYERIYHQHSGRIYNFILKLSHGNDYIAEEITQIVFMKLWEKMATVRDGETLKSYLISIAHNTLLDFLKHDTIEYIYLNYLKDCPNEDYTTLDVIDSSFLNSYLSILISELPPMRQKVFRMSRIEYMSNRQIAQVLGISVNTVKTHLSLALKFIREELKRRYDIIGNFPEDSLD